jgi:flagellar biosynthetic protein FliO
MSFWDILKAIIPLAVMFGLLYGVLWLVKRYTMPFGGKKFQSVKINVLNTQAIMPKKYLSVVQVHDKIFLLGVSEHSVNLIKELDGVEFEPDEEPDNRLIKNNFTDVLKKNLGLR